MTYPYCTHCGAQMAATPIPTGYNAKTGERLYKIQFSCPNRRFWRPLHDTGIVCDISGVSLFTELELLHDAAVPAEVSE